MRPSLAVANGDLWLMSTPCGKRGFFWEEWEHGGDEWERISVPATECSRISPELLAEEQAKGDVGLGNIHEDIVQAIGAPECQVL